MRALSAEARSIPAGDVVPVALVVEMQLSQPVSFNTSSHNIAFGGTTSVGAGGLAAWKRSTTGPAS